MNGPVGTTPSIRMGELAAIAGEGMLRTLLGSCIGLVLDDRRRRVCGLAHIVLPAATGKDGPPGKFVDTAVPALLEEMRTVAGTDVRPSARFAGGANMFATRVTDTIGRQNIQACERMLESLGIPVLARHCGGEKGRRMAVHAETGVVRIDIVGENTIEI